VKPLLACWRCGAETRHEVHFTGLLEATVPICEPCFETAMVEVNENKRQFEELLTGGMSREQANAVMCARIDGEAAS
jgi:hypothetical protein